MNQNQNDNGVFILETVGPEYRVAYINEYYKILNMDNNGKWQAEPALIKKHFDYAPVFTNQRLALLMAKEIARNVRLAGLIDLEYGVHYITLWKDETFESLTT